MTKKKYFTGITGALFVLLLGLSSVSNADNNPFTLTDQSEGFMVADGHEGKCGEGKCGDKTKAEGKCG